VRIVGGGGELAEVGWGLCDGECFQQGAAGLSAGARGKTVPMDWRVYIGRMVGGRRECLARRGGVVDSGGIDSYSE